MLATVKCNIAPAWATENSVKVFELINQRLSLMEEVAYYKFSHDLQVYDAEREKTVLNKSIDKASEAGLSGESTATFFQVQMDLAKSIQYRYFSDWVFRRPTNKRTVDLKTTIRPELIRLGSQIITAINNYLENGKRFSDEMKDEFMNTVTVKHLNDEEKSVLYRALQGITRSSSQN